MTQRFHGLEGFIDTLELLIAQAKAKKLVACSVNLDPTGLGHFSLKLLDGTAAEGDLELSDATPPTAPGKRKR